LPARSTEQDMGRFSLGVLSLMNLLEQMSREGIRRIDSGPAHYDYKIQYGGCESEYRSVLVHSTRSSSSVRVRLFVGLSDLIHLVYYRIWRLRIAPRLLFRRGPLWQTWIRSRI
jgi:CelD/BcsL family acetyltransferase involved in cellulose biosynthesis